jgi:hypothetical protein
MIRRAIAPCSASIENATVLRPSLAAPGIAEPLHGP